ncbi:hypothetical protein Tco_1144905 [Tanacetum coccineum]
MAASAIAISSDSSDESVGSPPSRVIIFGNISTVIPSASMFAPETSTTAPAISSATLVVEMTLVASPTGLCGLVPYSGSDSDSPDEMSSQSTFPRYQLFLHSYAPILLRLLILLMDHHRRTLMLLPLLVGGAGTHLNGLRKLLTVRKRVGPLPARRLASRQASPRSSVHHSSSSSLSLDSSPVHSLGLDASDQAHSGSSTRDVSPRLCYPPRRAPQSSEAFRHWCAAPLSTLYPPTTSESSLGDSLERPMHSSSHCAGQSRKRYRSPVDYVPSSMPVIGSLAPIRADLLPPHKRFRDSYSSKTSIEEDIEIDPIETGVDMESGIGDRDDVRDHVEIDPRDFRDDTKEYEADTVLETRLRDDIVRSSEDMPIDLDDAIRDFYHYMFEVRLDSIVRIKTDQRRLEADQLIARGQRVSMIERIDILRLENLKVHAMLDIKRDRVNSLRLYMSLSQEEFCQVRKDCDDNRERLRSDGDIGNGNGGNGNGRNENPDENVRGARPVARECTYQDFMKCQPLNFRGTEGVVGMIRWFEKMETVFHIRNYLEKFQVKYATCTLLDGALT